MAGARGAQARLAAVDDAFKKAMTNIGLEIEYMDQPEFKAFWDADAARVEAAVNAVGKVQG